MGVRLQRERVVLCGTAVTVLAGYDQAVPSYANEGRQALYRQDDDFVRAIETILSPNSAVSALKP